MSRFDLEKENPYVTMFCYVSPNSHFDSLVKFAAKKKKKHILIIYADEALVIRVILLVSVEGKYHKRNLTFRL